MKNIKELLGPILLFCSFILLIYIVIWGFRLKQWYDFNQMPNVWQIDNGNIMQIKQDGKWLNNGPKISLIN